MTDFDNVTSIFQEHAHSSRSPKYKFIPTTTIINDLETFGWNVHRAFQRNTRKEEYKGYQKHVVSFKNDAVTKQLSANELIPEIVVMNSHDGFSSFNLHAGIFRIICTNGLVVADSTFHHVKIPHKGYSIEEVQKTIRKYLNEFPKVFDSVHSFQNIALTPQNKKDLAEKAIKIRWPHMGNHLLLQPESLLVARRQSDSEKHDLWTVYNVIQENLFKAGLLGASESGRRVTTRQIKNIDLQISLNKDLWDLCVQFSKQIN